MVNDVEVIIYNVSSSLVHLVGVVFVLLRGRLRMVDVSVMRIFRLRILLITVILGFLASMISSKVTAESRRMLGELLLVLFDLIILNFLYILRY